VPFLLQPTSLRQIRFVNIPLEAGLPAQKVFILPLRNDPQSVLRSDAEVLSPKVGAEILLRISREFGKTMEWLLTGETFKLVFA
jgi:hypothetical protein